MTAILVLREALLFRSIFERVKQQEEEDGQDRMVLETMPPSHYVEKVDVYKP